MEKKQYFAEKNAHPLQTQKEAPNVQVNEEHNETDESLQSKIMRMDSK
jgi:hypothetical protein